MGMLFFHVPATSTTRRAYSDNLDAAAIAYIGWPVMAPDNYAVLYDDADGEQWACPGNGDAKLTEEIVVQIADDYSATHMGIFYREQGDTAGLTLVEATP